MGKGSRSFSRALSLSLSRSLARSLSLLSPWLNLSQPSARDRRSRTQNSVSLQMLLLCFVLWFHVLTALVPALPETLFVD